MKLERFRQTSKLLFIGCLLSCVTTPVTQRKSLNLVPKGQLIQMGETSFAEIKREKKLITSGPQFAAVVEIGRHIAKASGANFDWEFILIEDDETKNAFCLPGGKIAVYTGILPVAKTNAGLAAILGHEVAHATANHGGERVSHALVTQLGITVADVSLADNRYRPLIMTGLGLGAQVGVLLPYSRLHESEADTIGLHYMAKAGYETSEAVELWKRMAATGARGTPEFLATHPDPLKRSRKIAETLPQVAGLLASSQRKETKLLPGSR